MDSIGDYLYLIILVIAGLSSILKKKKSTDQKPQNAPAKPQKSWEEILKQLTPVEEEYNEVKTKEEFQIPEIEVVAPAPVMVAQPVIQSYENTEDVTAMRAQKHTSHLKTSTKHKQSPIIDTIEESGDLNFSFETTEDAKKAFIYSEIFNRKY